MALTVSRSSVKLRPDYKKVIPRFFNTGNARSLLLISRILRLENKDAEDLLQKYSFRIFNPLQEHSK